MLCVSGVCECCVWVLFVSFVCGCCIACDCRVWVVCVSVVCECCVVIECCLCVLCCVWVSCVSVVSERSVSEEMGLPPSHPLPLPQHALTWIDQQPRQRSQGGGAWKNAICEGGGKGWRGRGGDELTQPATAGSQYAHIHKNIIRGGRGTYNHK